MMDVYKPLKEALKRQISAHGLSGRQIRVRCKALSAAEAIGNPEHDDYPIIKGREVMVEAEFQGVKGQAFSDAYENFDLQIDDLVHMKLDTNRARAGFISGLNAVYRYLGLCDQTVHCKDSEPKTCAGHLPEAIGSKKKILLGGHQPRFLETLAALYQVRAIDLDRDNIGKKHHGVMIEPPEMTTDAVQWCDMIFATGSTIVNGSITCFLNQGKTALFYGVTISAAAVILKLDRYCYCGR